MKSTTNIAEITATHKAGKCLSEGRKLGLQYLSSIIC